MAFLLLVFIMQFPAAVFAQQSEVLFELRSFPCEKMKVGEKPEGDTIKRAMWINDSTLSVILQIQMNGAESVVRGSYSVSDSAIALIYQTTSCGDKSLPCAKWQCRSLLEYKFKGLKRNDYVFILNRTK